MSRRDLFRNPSAQPLFTGRELAAMNAGFIASYALSLLVGMLDTVMISTVGDAAVSGVSLVDSLTHLIVFVFSAFGTGGAVVAGQFLGNREDHRACESTEQLLWLSVMVSAACTLCIFLARGWLLTGIYGALTEEVKREAGIYLLITVFSFPAVAVYEAGSASIRAMGDSGSILRISLLMNGINVLGNAFLVFVLRMGTAGVAIPTLVSRWIAALMTVAILLDGRRRIHIPKRLHPALNREDVLRILKVGIPSGVENGIFQLGKLMIIRLVARFGTFAIAANALATVLTNINSLPGWGMTNGMMTVISRCAGAEDLRQAGYYHRLLCLVSAGLLTLWVGANCLLMPVSMRLFGSLTPEAVSMARTMVMVHAVGLLTCYVPSFLTPAALRSAGDVNFTMGISIFSMWLFRVGAAFLLAIPLGLGAAGTWVAMIIDWFFRAICFLLRWRSGRWKQMRVIG